MLNILILVSFLIVAVVAVEFLLHGRKVQSSLSHILPPFAVGCLLSLTLCLWSGNRFVFGILLFWGGSFLAWFGVRSHLESSILLRMLLQLRSRPDSEEALSTAYLDEYGPAARLEELSTGGLIERSQSGEVHVTAKGERVLRIARFLRGAEIK